MPSQKLNFKKIINRMILFIALGVGAHIIFVLSTTERSLLNYLNNLSVGHIFLIMFLMLLPWASYALRVLMWSAFLKEKIRYGDALKIVITADLASALSPTSVGGAPVKAALLLNRGYLSGSVAFLLTYGIIEDIVFYLTGIFFAAIFSVGLLSDISKNLIDFVITYYWQILFFAFFTIGYFYMLRKNKIHVAFRLWTYFPKRIKEKIYNFRSKLGSSIEGMKANFRLAIQHGKLRMLASILMLFIQWGSKFSVLLVILHAFDVDFDTVQMYVRQWVVYVTMLFIPTPGASGGAEASFLLIFGKSIPPELSYLIVSVWRLFTYYFVLLAAVIFYSILSFLMRKEEEIVIESNQ